MYKIIKVIIVLGKNQQPNYSYCLLQYRTTAAIYYTFNSYRFIDGLVFFYNFDAVLIVLSSDNLKADRTVIKLIENNTSPSPR